MTDVKTYIDFYKDERNSALLYEALAGMETDERLAGVYKRLAETEIRHAQTWVEKLAQLGHPEPKFKPDWQTHVLIWLGKRFGTGVILSVMQNLEKSGSQVYAQQPGNAQMARQEQFHGILLNNISRTVRGGMEGNVLAQLEGRHRGAGGNALRAAVLGANDGLVSNLSLVMGVAGATLDERTVLITGLAGMLAGAIIPVIAFFFLSGFTAILVSILSGVVCLFLLGAAITLFTGRPVLVSGMRMVIFGLLAAAVTFGIGRLIGVSVAG